MIGQEINYVCSLLKIKMIINPKLLNYRLIIGSLVIAIATVSIYSYTHTKTLKNHQLFIEQEKELVRSELSEMILSYETAGIKNDSIVRQLEEARLKLNTIIDSVTLLSPSEAVISKYKAQIVALREENAQLVAVIDGLGSQNTELKLETQNKTSTNLGLKENLKKAKQLNITGVNVKAVKRVTSSNRFVTTSHVNKTKQFQVCYILVKNQLLAKGPKELYIQILDSKMNVVADKGLVEYGKTSLIYSAKETVNYNNTDLEICTLIDKGTDKLLKGTYYIGVFYKGRKLGRTTITLK